MSGLSTLFAPSPLLGENATANKNQYWPDPILIGLGTFLVIQRLVD